MRRSEIIVARLLDEATGELPQEAPRGAVYVVWDNVGHAYKSVDALQQVMATDIDTAVNGGAVIIVAHDSNNITVYSKAIPVPVGTDTLFDIVEQLGILGGANTGWSKSVRVRPAQVDWHRVFASQEYMDKSEQEQEKMADEIERDQEKEQKAAEKGNTQVRAVTGTPAPVAEMPPEDAEHKLDIGFRYATLGNRMGVEVKHIYPDSPASQSYLEVGDIIVSTGPFAMRNGSISQPYRIKNADDLKRILGWLSPGHNFVMKVVRGSHEHDIVLTPQPAI